MENTAQVVYVAKDAQGREVYLYLTDYDPDYGFYALRADRTDAAPFFIGTWDECAETAEDLLHMAFVC